MAQGQRQTYEAPVRASFITGGVVLTIVFIYFVVVTCVVRLQACPTLGLGNLGRVQDLRLVTADRSLAEFLGAGSSEPVGPHYYNFADAWMLPGVLLCGSWQVRLLQEHFSMESCQVMLRKGLH